MMYLQASIKLHPGKLEDFISLINEIAPFINKKHGWKLLGSYGGLVGRLNTVVDWWEVPDANAVTALGIIARKGIPRGSRSSFTG